jgi:hypothetical protein
MNLELMNQILGIIAAIINLGSFYLVSEKKVSRRKYGIYGWIIGNGICMYLSIVDFNIGLIAQWIGYMILNFKALICWKNDVDK